VSTACQIRSPFQAWSSMEVQDEAHGVLSAAFCSPTPRNPTSPRRPSAGWPRQARPPSCVTRRRTRSARAAVASLPRPVWLTTADRARGLAASSAPIDALLRTMRLWIPLSDRSQPRRRGVCAPRRVRPVVASSLRVVLVQPGLSPPPHVDVLCPSTSFRQFSCCREGEARSLRAFSAMDVAFGHGSVLLPRPKEAGRARVGVGDSDGCGILTPARLPCARSAASTSPPARCPLLSCQVLHALAKS